MAGLSRRGEVRRGRAAKYRKQDAKEPVASGETRALESGNSALGLPIFRNCARSPRLPNAGEEMRQLATQLISSCPAVREFCHDRPSSPAAFNLRCRGRGCTSRCRAGGPAPSGAEGTDDLPCRRQGRRRDGRRGGAALSRYARPRAVAAGWHRHHPPRPRRADPAHQGGRGRPPRAR